MTPRYICQSLTTIIVLAIIGSVGCDRYPKDPGNTLEEVRGDELKVGVVEAPPWVVRGESGPEGIEVDIVRDFAASLNARISWRWGSESEHFESIKHGQIHLIVGGITKSNPWTRHAGITRPFYTERLTVGWADPASIREVDGVEVRVAEGSSLVGLLEEQDAIPVEVVDPFAGEPPVAGPAWELAARGLIPDAENQLGKRKHVMAFIRGENAFLFELERTLEKWKGRVEESLRATADGT